MDRRGGEWIGKRGSGLERRRMDWGAEELIGDREVKRIAAGSGLEEGRWILVKVAIFKMKIVVR